MTDETNPATAGNTPTRRRIRADEETLNRALTGDGTHILFLHDPWCPISDHANTEVEQIKHEIVQIDVSTQREYSRLVAKQTGIRHESPQVIVLRDGAVRWHASHMRIKATALAEAIAGADERTQR